MKTCHVVFTCRCSWWPHIDFLGPRSHPGQSLCAPSGCEGPSLQTMTNVTTSPAHRSPSLHITNGMLTFVDVPEDSGVIDGARNEGERVWRPAEVVHVLQVPAQNLDGYPVLPVHLGLVGRQLGGVQLRLQFPDYDDRL